MEGKKVAVGKGYGVQEYLQRAFPDIELILVPNDLEGLRKLSFGEIDAVIMDVASASFFIDREKITNLHIAGTTDFTYDLSFAIRKDWPVLQSILSKTLDAIPDAKKLAVLDKWIRIEANPFFLIWTQFKSLILVLSALTVMGIIIAIVAWNMTLRRTIIARTSTLRKSEAIFKGVFEESLMGITLKSADYKERLFNPAFCRMVGYA